MAESGQHPTKFENISGEFITRSPEETFDFAEKIGAQIDSATIFLLTGDLGAGKTLFAKGLASGLDIDPADVTSPTFTLINRYEGRLRMYHIDLYRLDEGAGYDLGLEEIFEESAITLIEWAERLGYVPAAAIKVEIEYVADSERKIKISPLS